MRILLVEEDTAVRATRAWTLRAAGHAVRAIDAAAAAQALLDGPLDVLVLNLGVGAGATVGLMPLLAYRHPDARLILMVPGGDLPAAPPCVDAVLREPVAAGDLLAAARG